MFMNSSSGKHCLLPQAFFLFKISQRLFASMPFIMFDRHCTCKTHVCCL